MYLETSVDAIFLFTLRLQLEYMLKVLSLSAFRFPNISALEVINRDISWFRQWKVLCDKFNLEFNISLNSISGWSAIFSALYERISSTSPDEYLRQAQSSTRFQLYRELFDQGPTIFNVNITSPSSFNLSELRWLFKLTKELLYLNYTSWLVRDIEICSLYNPGAREDVFHFVADCKISTELRLLWLAYRSLIKSQFIFFLHTNNCKPLLAYAGYA